MTNASTETKPKAADELAAADALKRKAEADNVRDLGSRLWSAFEWMQSPQGHSYWEEVARNLDDLADRIEAGK